MKVAGELGGEPVPVLLLVLLWGAVASGEPVRATFSVRAGDETGLTAEERALVRAHRELVPPTDDLHYRIVPQKILAPRVLVMAWGWRDGGHQELPPRLLILDQGQVGHVVPETHNLDEDGYRRELVDVRVCRIGYFRGLDGVTSEDKLRALREKECRSFWKDVRGDVRLLAILQDEGREAKVVEKVSDLEPQLRKLVEGGKTHEARWVPGATPQKPGKGNGNAGWLTVSVGNTTWLQRFTLGTTFRTEQLAHTVQYIE